MQHKRIMPGSHVLILSCEDRPGPAAAVAGLLFESGGNILGARQFDDAATSSAACWPRGPYLLEDRVPVNGVKTVVFRD